MADAIIELVTNPLLSSLTLILFPAGNNPTTNDVAATSAITMTEATNQKGLYTGTTSAGLTGLYRAVATINGTFIQTVGFVYMTDAAVIHRIMSVAGGDVMLSNMTTVITLLNSFIAGGQSLTYGSVVSPSGRMTVVLGDSYYTIDGRAALWYSSGAWPDLTGADVLFYVYGAAPELLRLVVVDGFVNQATGAGQSVGVELAVDDLADLALGATLNYAINITLANGHPFTPIVAQNKLIVSTGIGLVE